MQHTNEFNTKDMVNVVGRLSDILKEEVSLIKNMQLSKLHKRQEEKEKLTAVVEGYRNMIKADPMLVKVLSDTSLQEIKTVTKEFEEVVQQEEEQLIRARKVHHFIMDSVRKVINKRIESTSMYNKKGYLDDVKKKAIYTQPISVSEMA